MNLKIGDIVKAKDCEIRLVVVGASDKGYDLFQSGLTMTASSTGRWMQTDTVTFSAWARSGMGRHEDNQPPEKNRKGRYLT